MILTKLIKNMNKQKLLIIENIFVYIISKGLFENIISYLSTILYTLKSVKFYKNIMLISQFRMTHIAL